MIKFKFDDPPKWTPGQRLNFAAEVIDALRDGQKLAYPSGAWFHLREDGHVYDQDGRRAVPNLLNPNCPWHIYTPPKRKVKSERVIAIMPGTVNIDNLFWVVCDSMYDAESQFPDAIAYNRVELEVEVDGNS